MGWTFQQGQSKEGLIRELVSESSSTYTTIAHTCKGSNLWVVIERKPDTPEHTERGYKRPHRLILLYLLENRAGDGWGYKDMDEYGTSQRRNPAGTSRPTATWRYARPMKRQSAAAKDPVQGV